MQHVHKQKNTIQYQYDIKNKTRVKNVRQIIEYDQDSQVVNEQFQQLKEKVAYNNLQAKLNSDDKKSSSSGGSNRSPDDLQVIGLKLDKVVSSKQEKFDIQKIERYSDNKSSGKGQVKKIISSSSKLQAIEYNQSYSENTVDDQEESKTVQKENLLCTRDTDSKQPALVQKFLQNGKFDKFTDISYISRGGFGAVYRARHLDGQNYAIKRLHLQIRRDQDIRKHRIFRQVTAMTRMDRTSKFIVSYYTTWLELGEDNRKKNKLRDQKQKYIYPKQQIKQSQKKPRKESKSSSMKSVSSYSKDSIGFQFVTSQTGEENKINEYTKNSQVNSFQIEEEEDEETLNSDNESDDYTHQDSLIHISKGQYDEDDDDFDDQLQDKTDQNNDQQQTPSVLLCDSHYQNKMDLEFKKQDFIIVNLHIQMQLCEGKNLRDYLNSRPKIDLNNSKQLRPRRLLNHQLFLQMLKGVRHFHSCGIIHRDLKPPNIFIVNQSQQDDIRLKIGDFGLAVGQKLGNKSYHSELNLHKMSGRFSFNVGTPLYQSPEQLVSGKYDEKVDIYSLGIILMQMCCQFVTGHERDLTLRALRSQKQIIDQKVLKFYKIQSQIIKMLTQHDPSKRPSAKQLLKHDLIMNWRKDCELYS